MALSDITRDDVLAAVSEWKAQGRDSFLSSYGFQADPEHVLLHEGELYDAAALAAAAHGFARPEFGALTPVSLPSPDEVTAHLADLGFDTKRAHRVQPPSPSRQRDLRRWRSTYELIKVAANNDPATQGIWAQVDSLRADRVAEARELLGDLALGRDLQAFVEAFAVWSRRPGPFAAQAVSLPTWLGQLRGNAGGYERDAADLLVETTRTPNNDDEAAGRIRALEEFVGRDLDASRVVTLLSLFWSTDERGDWPTLWPAGSDPFQQLGWMGRHLGHAERYLAFAELCRSFEPDDPRTAERTVGYLGSKGSFVGLGTALPDVCEEAAELIEGYRPASGYTDAEAEALAAALALQLRGVATLTVRSLHAPLQHATGLRLHETNLQTRVGQSKDAPYRVDAHATWTLPGGIGAPGFRLWVTRTGVAVGLHSGWDGPGSGERHEQIGRAVEQTLPEDLRFFHLRALESADRVEPVGREFPGGEVYVGRWWPHPQALGRADFAADVIETVRALSPLVEVMAGKEPTPTGPVDVELLSQLERFVAERPYPNDRDRWHLEQRRALAQSLEPAGLDAFDLAAFRRVLGGRSYGHPGTHSVLQASLASMDAAGLDAFARSLKQLLWGEGDDVARIEHILGDGSPAAGLGEAVVMKLMAIAHPGRYLPLYSLGGADGKVAVARAIGVELPPIDNPNRARLHVVANDRLRARLEPLLPADPWGQVQFALWLLRKGESVADPERDLIAEAAGELLVDEDFLREVHGLLEDKKQVIFYGPPGTGKTYLAQRLAAALQPDSSKRQVVQFHPSTSYEDFFEGFRPRLDADGQMVYELRRGPLAMLAEAAEADPTTPHIMLIDEINRANLPRVFGELLYLLEYRSQSVMTSYRPDEGFELPPNLYFIGTMNTADRSIALVDAALRRRFHFVPFMPHEGPMEGLLRRWLITHEGPVWVAGVVDLVNDELRRALRGPHLQIGHSHFMVEGLDDAALQRIWTYSIYPFIEDQFYGREDVLRTFTWHSVVERHGPRARAAAGELPPPASN
ncbi:5-methylcytosine-specific restriction protein B [Rudaeicoccus suwonensis]|uniref:5-methylcytosine-specific restriction protein B n=1 Tax=Rudaeicoccus suwonensis TaxID=657409 RepID=A0A561ECE1_9MICO|nr:5-methylcytosine-specific restriction protein B [Rudaeicoccus suwonensis]